MNMQTPYKMLEMKDVMLTREGGVITIARVNENRDLDEIYIAVEQVPFVIQWLQQLAALEH